MSLTQPQPHVDVWQRFTVDPRIQPAVRASDADRDVAASVLNDAFGDGRLDRIEHAERLETVMRARTLGELAPMLSDVVVSARATPVVKRRIRSTAVRSWVGLAVLFNVIWLLTVFSAGKLIYYWPMWPMLGTAIPLLVAWMATGTTDGVKQRRSLPPTA